MLSRRLESGLSTDAAPDHLVQSHHEEHQVHLRVGKGRAGSRPLCLCAAALLTESQRRHPLLQGPLLVCVLCHVQLFYEFP